jgi:hypothetical protein
MVRAIGRERPCAGLGRARLMSASPPTAAL